LEPRSPVARDLWIQVAEITREARITVGEWDVAGAANTAQRQLASLWARIFPQRLSLGEPGTLSGFLGAFTSCDCEFMSLVLTLDDAGVSLDEIAEALAGWETLRFVAVTALDDLRADQQHTAGANGETRVLESFLSRLR
jgi:hypothetical protein